MVEEEAIIEGGDGLLVQDGMAVAWDAEVAALAVALVAADSQEVAAVLVEVEAADRGKRFKRFGNSALGFRLYLAYFCASLKTVHEKG